MKHFHASSLKFAAVGLLYLELNHNNISSIDVKGKLRSKTWT